MVILDNLKEYNLVLNVVVWLFLSTFFPSLFFAIYGAKT